MVMTCSNLKSGIIYGNRPSLLVDFKIEKGGVVQGIGFALSEEFIFNNGAIQNPDFRDYKIPLCASIPEKHSFFVETNEPAGPFGAKGIGEPTMNPTAPTIANAIYNAIGTRGKSLPITPEKILKALSEKNKGR